MVGRLRPPELVDILVHGSVYLAHDLRVTHQQYSLVRSEYKNNWRYLVSLENIPEVFNTRLFAVNSPVLA